MALPMRWFHEDVKVTIGWLHGCYGKLASDDLTFKLLSAGRGVWFLAQMFMLNHLH